MRRMAGWWRLGLLFGLAAAGLASAAHAADAPPNVLVILCDDLGYGDLGCFGSPIVKSPHIDRLAAEGVRFTDCHSAGANCSPSRCGLMTGRTPYRAGIYNWIPENSPMHLRPSEITLATLLKARGYQTAHVGKWHLNGQFNSPEQPQPGDHGFEHWFSTQNNAAPDHARPTNFVRNGTPVGPTSDYSSGVVVNEAIAWLSRRDPSRPFFLYLCFHEPHEPIATEDRFASLYADQSDPLARALYGNISQMDFHAGRLLAKLDELGLRDSTFVYFTSDNGPAITRQHPYGSSGPLRSKKGSLYEGGHRVPGIVRWPGKARPGTTCDTPINGTDLLPTVCEVVGATPPADRVLDGTSWLPALDGRPVARRVPLYWQFNRSQDAPRMALRDGDWKILATFPYALQRKAPEETELTMPGRPDDEPIGFELYNLRDDVGETKNLAEAAPEKLAELREKLVALYHELRAEGPTWTSWTPPGGIGRKAAPGPGPKGKPAPR